MLGTKSFVMAKADADTARPDEAHWFYGKDDAAPIIFGYPNVSCLPGRVRSFDAWWVYVVLPTPPRI
jgi:hypothetical protein